MKDSISTLIAAAEPVASQSSIFDALTIVIVGFTFVLFVLLLLSATIWSIGVFFTCMEKTESQPVVEKSETPVGDSAIWDGELDPHEIAVVTAAIHCVVGDQAHRIVSIRSGSSSWAQEGRRQIFTSRRVR